MNNKILNKWIFGAALLLLAACTQDELTEQVGTLPKGMYPLEVSSATLSAEVGSQPWGADAPQTRVSENPDRNSSKWDGGEVITVQLGDNETTTTYEVQTDGSLELTGDRLYWAKRNDKVMAWYPANGTIDLSNQSERLAYVLQANETANFDQPVTLNFEHKLAKIRVKLTGEKAGDVNNVKIESYISCTNTSGMVSTDGASTSEITMHRVDDNTYEANVVPDVDITRFKVNGGDWVGLSTKVTPIEGRVHEITITVNQKIPEITGGEISEPGDYIMTGNITESVTLNASGINLTLDNVQSKTDGAPIIIGNNAQVTLNILGTANSLTSTNGNGIEIREGASLSITGNGMNSSKLVVNASDNTNPDTELKAGIGPSTGNVSIKTINISNVHLVVSGGRTGNNGNGPAAIGLCSVNGTYNQSCEGISITDSKIEATSYGGACIGTGSVSNDIYTGGTYNLGPITITSSQIIATANPDSGWGHSGACIGFGYIGSDANGVIENITITKSTLDLTVGNSNAYKIGRGDIENNATYSITNGIIVDGQNKGNEGWNP